MSGGLVGKVVAKLRSRTGGVAVATVSAQGLNTLTTVVLAWFAGAELLGVYSVFLSWASITLVANLLSYQWSVPNVDDGAPLRDLMVLLLGLSVGSAAVVGAALGLGGYGAWGWLMALVAVRSVLLVGEQLCVRTGAYGWLMVARAAPPAVLFAGVCAWWAAAWPVDVGGLLALHTAAFAATAVPVALATIPAALTAAGAPPPTWSSVRALAVAERGFSLWVTPAQVFNRLAYDLPTLLLADTLGPAVAAQYAMAMRVAKVPSVTLGQAIAQVYHGDLARAVRERSPGAWGLYARARRRMMVGGALVFFGCAVVAPPLIVGVLGEEWRLAGDLVRILSPLLAIHFVVSPLSVSFFVFEDQRFLFFHQLAYALISAVCFGQIAWTGALVPGAIAFSALSTLRYVVILRRQHHLHVTHLRGPGAAAEAE